MGFGSSCRTTIGLWAVGFSGYCIDGPMGYRFGASGFKQAVIEASNQYAPFHLLFYGY